MFTCDSYGDTHSMLTITEAPVEIEDADFYERKFRENEAKKYAHIFTYITDDPSLMLDGYPLGKTLCGHWLRFKRATTMRSVKCAECIRLHLG